MSKSRIEWTGSTWNPIRARNLVTGQTGTHCVKVSPGCAHCYAEAHNLRNLPKGSSGLPYRATAGVEYFVDFKVAEVPLRRLKPETYFVCSMTDLFLEAYSFPMIQAVVARMCPPHTFQVLTKRPERIPAFLGWQRNNTTMTGFPSNTWVGVSVEDRKHGLPRIDRLREVPAALRFLSIEPLLEDLGEIDLTGIDWVIIGGESGRSARPCHASWITSLLLQCSAAGIPAFVKQLGAQPLGVEFGDYRSRSHKHNHPEEWPLHLRVREMPEPRHAS